MKLEEKLVHNIISSTVCLHYLEQLKHTKFYSKELKYFGNKFKAELIKREQTFDEIENHEENALTHCYAVYYDYIKEVSVTEINETGELTENY